MAHGGMIGKPGGLVEEGVTMYGVEKRYAGKSYRVSAKRRGNTFAQWAKENNIKNGSDSFTNKTKAESALKKFYEDNPTYHETGEHSSKMEKQYKMTDKKRKVLDNMHKMHTV